MSPKAGQQGGGAPCEGLMGWGACFQRSAGSRGHSGQVLKEEDAGGRGQSGRERGPWAQPAGGAGTGVSRGGGGRAEQGCDEPPWGADVNWFTKPVLPEAWTTWGEEMGEEPFAQPGVSGSRRDRGGARRLAH